MMSAPSIDDYLLWSEEDLLIALGEQTIQEPMLHSPDQLIETSRAFIKGIWPRLQETICPNRHLMELPEAQMAAAFAVLLANTFVLGIANIVAVYLVKRGALLLCSEWVPPDA